MQRITVESPERLDRWLAEHLPTHSRTRLAKWIDEGKVLVDGEVRKPGFGLKSGMLVEFEAPGESAAHALEPIDIPLEVLYEDDDLLVVNKPRGMASHPAPSQRKATLVHALLARGHALSEEGGSFRPGIVHRLDKDTTGLLMVAKNDLAHRALQVQIQEKTAERRYVLVVRGEPERERFRVEAPIARDPALRKRMRVDAEGRPALTHFKRLVRLDSGWLMAARLETGRTHQIRVHAAAVGLPVLGDDLYAPKEFARGALQLHAGYLAFDQPRTGTRIACYCEPPHDFEGRGHINEQSLDPW